MPASTYSYAPKQLPPSGGKKNKPEEDDGKSFLDQVASRLIEVGVPTLYKTADSVKPVAKALAAAAGSPSVAGIRSGPTSIPAPMVSRSKAAPKQKEESQEMEAPRAKVVEDDEVVQSFFAKTHGGSFDPNSRSDRSKMNKILGMVNSNPEMLSMSPAKFAMKVYASN